MAYWTFPPEAGEDSPWPHFQRVLAYPELAIQHSLVEAEVTFAFVFREDPDDWLRGGKRILGTAQMPGVTGALSGLFDQMLEDTLGYLPDFMIVLNRTYWADASDKEREILIFHEAKHCGQALDVYGVPKFNKRTGRPILSMVGHDVEEFNDVVARYGAWKSDLVRFRAAFDAGPPPTQNAPTGELERAIEAMRNVLEEGGMTMTVIAPDDLLDGQSVITNGLRDLTSELDDGQLDRGGLSHRESPDDVF